jgi:hypothetical protein
MLDPDHPLPIEQQSRALRYAAVAADASPMQQSCKRKDPVSVTHIIAFVDSSTKADTLSSCHE